MVSYKALNTMDVTIDSISLHLQMYCNFYNQKTIICQDLH